MKVRRQLLLRVLRDLVAQGLVAAIDKKYRAPDRKRRAYRFYILPNRKRQPGSPRGGRGGARGPEPGSPDGQNPTSVEDQP